MATKHSAYKPTAIRLPPDLHQQVKESASEQERSFNGQIVFLLKDGLAHQKPVTQPQGATA